MLALCIVSGASAQVKIGHDAHGTVNSAAVLELSNDLSAPSNEWKALVLPYVNFDSVLIFPDTAAWGIAGTPTDGAMVYNTGTRDTDGFIGAGVYVWNKGVWSSLHTPPPPPLFQDPGATPGDTGYVTFTYDGAQVTYTTVRAGDGKIWLVKNLGADHVATSSADAGALGHLFQWGRWDDGHQVRTSPTVNGSASSLNNPSHIPSGNPNFIMNSNASDAWWGTAGLATNTWSDNPPSATNGTDPCSALGTGWHVPSQAEWTALTNAEFISDDASALSSRLKLPMPGFRNGANGGLLQAGTFGYYWSGTALAGESATAISFDGSGLNSSASMARRHGVAVRCVK